MNKGKILKNICREDAMITLFSLNTNMCNTLEHTKAHLTDMCSAKTYHQLLPTQFSSAIHPSVSECPPATNEAHTHSGGPQLLPMNEQQKRAVSLRSQ